MASSRKTGTNEVVQTYGDGTRERTSLNGWESATQLTLTSGFEQVTVSSLSGRMRWGETLNFSPSGATATFRGHSPDESQLYYVVTGGTPTTSDSITGATSGKTCDIDSIDSTNTGISPVLECYDDASTFDDSLSTDSPATASASYFRIVRPASGEGHDGTPNNGVHIHSTYNGSTFNLPEGYISIQDLIVQHTINVAGGSKYGVFGNAVGGQSFIGVICIDVVDNGTGPGSIGIGFQNAFTYYAYNCLVIRAELYALPYGNSNAQFLSSQVVDAGSHGVYGYGGSPVLRNVLAHNSGGSDYSGTHGTRTYIASSDNTATGTGSRINQTFTFVASGSDDWQITSTDTGAKGYGYDDSATFDDDIEGTIRTSPWDIGAFKFETVGGGFPNELFAHERRNTLLRM